MKLEQKHIKGYLGTGLKCYCSGMHTADTEFDDKPKPKIFEIVGMNNVFVEIFEEGRTVTEEMYFEDVFPILRPLSDLTKEIEVNGEKFVPYKKLGWILYRNECGIGSELSFGDAHSGTVNVLDYLDDLEKIYEWHFDIYGLIEQNLAIDINTL